MSNAEDRYLEHFQDGRLRDCSRKEAFLLGYHQAEKELIDKAIGWIEEINNYHEIMRYSDSCEPPLSELTEWFKNYIKEGCKDE
jgi:hypothetical protein